MSRTLNELSEIYDSETWQHIINNTWPDRNRFKMISKLYDENDIIFIRNYII